MNTIFTSFPSIKTERLKLRRLEQSDSADVFILRSDYALFEFLPFPPAKDISEMTAYIQKMQQGSFLGDSILWGITEAEKPTKVIGSVCLFHYDKEARKAELGYVLNKDFQGKGYMHEAAKSVCDFAFYAIKADLLIAIIHDENNKSVKLVQRLGFELEKAKQWQLDEKHAVTYSLRNSGNKDLS